MTAPGEPEQPSRQQLEYDVRFYRSVAWWIGLLFVGYVLAEALLY